MLYVEQENGSQLTATAFKQVIVDNHHQHSKITNSHIYLRKRPNIIPQSCVMEVNNLKHTAKSFVISPIYNSIHVIQFFLLLFSLFFFNIRTR